MEQGFVRLSDSNVWDFQRHFYEENTTTAWTENIVPSFQTTNAFIAAQYARLILALVRDCSDIDGPVYVLDVGAGHGKLGYLIVTELLEMRGLWPDCSKVPFKYILSDVIRENVDFYKSHSLLSKYFEAGFMDCACFDAETDGNLFLEIAQEELDCGPCPMFCVFNYVLDTLRHDVFRCVGRELEEGLCSSELTDTGEITMKWQYRRVENASDYYSGKFSGILNQILVSYAEMFKFENASLIIPIGGIKSVCNLERMTSGNIVLVIGDKGYLDVDELKELRDPHVATHGSFSMMVNLHALRILFENILGGNVLQTRYTNGFKCMCCYLRLPAVCMPELSLQWEDDVAQFDPNSFSTVYKSVHESTSHRAPSLKLSLAMIRLSRHDADVFYKLRQCIIEQTPFSTPRQRYDIRIDVFRIAKRHFFGGATDQDVFFELGRVLMGIKAYREAIGLFDKSQRECGFHPVSWYNKGICEYHLNNLGSAVACFEKSLLLDDTCAEAKAWKAKALLLTLRPGP